MTTMGSARRTFTIQQHKFEFDAPQIIYALVFGAVVLFVLYPVLTMLVNSLLAGPIGGERHWSLEGWTTALSDTSMLRAVWNTFKLVIANELISLPTAVILAWLIGRTDLPFRNTFEFIFWIAFFLPSLSVTLGWIVLLDPDHGLLNRLILRAPFIHEAPFNIFSFWGVVWAHLSTSAISVKVMMLTPVFRNIDGSLEEASKIMGASALQSAARIAFPLALPAILTVLVLSIIRAMQTFEIEMVLGPSFGFWVYGTKIYTLVGQAPPELEAATALASIGFLLITPMILCHRWLVSGNHYTTVTGRIRVTPTALGHLRYPALITVTILVVTLTGLPVGFLVISSFMTLFGFFDIADPWTLEHWYTVLSGEFFIQSLLNTAEMAIGAGLVSAAACAMIAYFVVKSSYRGRALLDFLSWLPFAIPGILLGVGLLYVFLGNSILKSFYGTIPLLVLATVVGGLTFGTQILKSTLLQLSKELEEAARISGASWLRAFSTIMVPILMPTLVLVAIINFISATRDISSIALLATNSTKTLSLLQLDYLIDGQSEIGCRRIGDRYPAHDRGRLDRSNVWTAGRYPVLASLG